VDVSVRRDSISHTPHLPPSPPPAFSQPTSGVDTQTATIQVVVSGSGTSSWTDTLGNPGLASNTLSITEDTKSPTVTVAGSPTLKAGQTNTKTYPLTETVTGVRHATQNLP